MKTIISALSSIDSIKKRIHKTDRVFLFLDYDGTLTEIKSRPEEALPGKDMIDFFNKFTGNKYIISIISGRSLKDLKSLLRNIRSKEINLIGSHGLEIQFADNLKESDDIQPVQLKETRQIEILKKMIIPQAEKIKNTLIEVKPASFAIHYRNVPAEEIDNVHSLIKKIDNMKKQYSFRYLNMKKVVEIMPVDIDKGKSINRIIKASNVNNNKDHLIICIGDDVTDEDMFLTNKSGINIKVTRIPIKTFEGISRKLETEADYYLKNPGEVICFLKRITGHPE
jgi:trehalose-phosphatase